jgi:5-methylcytosine-specific restriction endonuclease McrA
MASRSSDDGAAHEQRDIKPQREPIRLHTTPRKPGWQLRYRVLERDGFRCQACGRSSANDPGVRLHIDHITPWRRGGETTAANLQTLCQMCNGGKADLPGKKRRRRRQRKKL